MNDEVQTDYKMSVVEWVEAYLNADEKTRQQIDEILTTGKIPDEVKQLM